MKSVESIKAVLLYWRLFLDRNYSTEGKWHHNSGIIERYQRFQSCDIIFLLKKKTQYGCSKLHFRTVLRQKLCLNKNKNVLLPVWLDFFCVAKAIQIKKFLCDISIQALGKNDTFSGPSNQSEVLAERSKVIDVTWGSFNDDKLLYFSSGAILPSYTLRKFLSSMIKTLASLKK